MTNQNGKERYNSIEIPKELNNMINNEFKSNHEKKNKRGTLISSISALAAIFIFTISLNVSETFAQSLSEIPVLKEIASVLTFRDYSYETENVEAEVTIPKIVDLEDSSLEDKINKLIEEKVNNILEEAEIRAAEYKEAFIATGGSEEEYAERKIQVNVDYEIKSSNDDILSFTVFTSESLAAVYAENIYYNIDLSNNTVLTLEDLLGSDYISVVSKSVKESVELQKENTDNSFFEDIDSDSWTVREDIDFYVNDKNNVVVVFEKYEIAPGYMGRLEYEILTN